MKKMTDLNEKTIVSRLGAFAAAAGVLAANVSAAGADFSKVAEPIIDLLNSILGPLLGIVGALGAIYCVILGVKFAKAEEPQDREKAKTHLKNAIIGFVIIFVLLLALRLITPILTNWVNANGGNIST